MANDPSSDPDVKTIIIAQQGTDEALNMHYANLSSTQAFMDAAKEGNLQMVNFFIGQEGTNRHVQDAHKRTALHHAVLKGHADIVTCLIQHGLDVNAPDNFNITPLFLAPNQSIAQLLLDAKAYIHHKDNQGFTPLSFIFLHKFLNEERIALIKYLISKGADINTKNNARMTPLDIAHANGAPLHLIQYLESQGASLNKTPEGRLKRSNTF